MDHVHVLGVPPALERGFREEEDRVGAPKVIVLSDRVWRDRFDARPDAIGQSLMASGVPHTISGVMPPGFGFPGNSGAWTPMQTDPLRHRGDHSWQVIGRISASTSIEQVRLDLNRVATDLAREYPTSNLGWGVDVVPLREQLSGDIRPVVMLMMASVAFVILIACANVANLLLARHARDVVWCLTLRSVQLHRSLADAGHHRLRGELPPCPARIPRGPGGGAEAGLRGRGVGWLGGGQYDTCISTRLPDRTP